MPTAHIRPGTDADAPLLRALFDEAVARLVAAAAAEARDVGAAVLRVDCWAGAPPLVAWYERQGFARVGDLRRRRLDRAGLHDAAVTPR